MPGIGIGFGSGGRHPSLNLDFTSGVFDPRITFARSTTATYFGADGLLKTAAANAPRFDHDPITGESKGLLIEEQRTNLLTYSEQFDNAAWALYGGASKTGTNVAAAPDGTTTADSIRVTTAGTGSNVYQAPTLAAGTHTISCWVKRNAASDQTFQLFTNIGGTESASGDLIATGTWQRFTFTGTGGAGVSVPGIIGNVAGVQADLLVWGAQLEAGAFPTSYIPTTTAQVTRVADAASMTGANFSSWYRQDEGTLCAQFAGPALGNRAIAGIDDDTANEQMQLRGEITDPKFIVTDGGTGQASIDAGTIAASTVYRIAAAYKANDFAVSLGGATPVTDTSGTLPTVDRLRIGTDQGGATLCGHIKRLAYYPRRLSDSTLQALTA